MATSSDGSAGSAHRRRSSCRVSRPPCHRDRRCPRPTTWQPSQLLRWPRINEVVDVIAELPNPQTSKGTPVSPDACNAWIMYFMSIGASSSGPSSVSQSRAGGTALSCSPSHSGCGRLRRPPDCRSGYCRAGTAPCDNRRTSVCRRPRGGVRQARPRRSRHTRRRSGPGMRSNRAVDVDRRVTVDRDGRRTRRRSPAPCDR